MEDNLIRAKVLATKLVERRLPSVENELAKICRKLKPQEILEIVLQLIRGNVRAAAAIAARAQLPVVQQLDLLYYSLTLGQTNTIKALVSDVFARRMRAENFLKHLNENRDRFPVAVHFAAYYFLAAANMKSEMRVKIRKLLEATKPE